MQTIKLQASSFIDFPERGYASYITNKNQLKTCHFHDFYEIFLVDYGSCIHQVNGSSQNISTGDLCFIRPNDVHYYDQISDDFRIINIIIPAETIQGLFAFLGEGFLKENLLTNTLPSIVSLNFSDLNLLIKDLEQLIIYKKIFKEKSDSRYKITIFNIITKFFSIKFINHNITSIPEWLRWLSLEMLKKENFKEGLPALYKLSGKSPEHLSRACKRFLYKTPSKIVTDIRIEYAAKQLVSTNTPIINISMECGFDSLSYFYHRFKEHYGLTPKGFRLKAKKEEIEVYLMGDLSVKAEIPASIPFPVRNNLKTPL